MSPSCADSPRTGPETSWFSRGRRRRGDRGGGVDRLGDVVLSVQCRVLATQHRQDDVERPFEHLESLAEGDERDAVRCPSRSRRRGGSCRSRTAVADRVQVRRSVGREAPEAFDRTGPNCRLSDAEGDTIFGVTLRVGSGRVRCRWRDVRREPAPLVAVDGHHQSNRQ